MTPRETRRGGGGGARPLREETVADLRASAVREPVFRALDREECGAVLARNEVGRIAFSLHDRVDIEPIHYVYHRGWLYGRTSIGAKLATLQHSKWVAFEVDEVEGVFDWRSVVAHGGFYVLSPDGAPREARAWERGVELLRALVPETWSTDDPVPFRTVIFRIHVAEMTGRMASTGAPERARRARTTPPATTERPSALPPETDR